MRKAAAEKRLTMKVFHIMMEMPGKRRENTLLHHCVTAVRDLYHMGVSCTGWGTWPGEKTRTHLSPSLNWGGGAGGLGDAPSWM